MARGLMSHRLFWGFMFLLVGILALLQNYGLSPIDLDRFWPIFLVVIGLWIMLHHRPDENKTTPVIRKRRRK